MRVPYSTVGLIVGPKGTTIKRIQRRTKTFIKSPDRGAESIFEIIGPAENVEKARQEINAFVVWRGIDQETIETEETDDLDDFSLKEDFEATTISTPIAPPPPPPPPQMGFGTPPHTPRHGPPRPFYAQSPRFHQPPRYPIGVHRMLQNQLYRHPLDRQMLPPDLVTQQFAVGSPLFYPLINFQVQQMSYSPGQRHPPMSYARPCYFIETPPVLTTAPIPAVEDDVVTGVTRVEKREKCDDKKDADSETQIVIHPAQV